MTVAQATSERLHDQVAALRRYDARMKGLASLASARTAGACVALTSLASPASRAPDLFAWHWQREVMLPTSLGKLPASLFDDPAVRLALAVPPLMKAGLVARALYARRSAVRRCIDRTVLTQLRVALGDGTVGYERLQRLQRLAAADGDVPLTLPLPDTLTSTTLAHDGLARLRRAHPKLVPVVVHFVLMQLDGTPLRITEDSNDADADGRIGAFRHAAPMGAGADATFEAATFFERLPHIIPELT